MISTENSNFMHRRQIYWMGLAVFIGAIPSLFHQDWVQLFGHLWENTTIVLFVCYLTRWARDLQELRIRYSTFFYMIALATIFVGFGWASWEGGQNQRIQLFFGNPNLLGASIAVTATGVLLLKPSPNYVIVTPLAVLALLNTGSRAALIAFFLAWFALIIVNGKVKARNIIYLVIPICIAVAIVFAAQSYTANIDRMLRSPNLLLISSSFANNYWNKYPAVRMLSVESQVITGPLENTKADKITARTEAGQVLVIYQGIGRAESGTPYVGSIYLRADEPQQIVLSTHLAKVTCDIDDRWRRCITPVGYGGPETAVQLRLETIRKGGYFSIYAWGAQLEIGKVATPLRIKYLIPDKYYLYKRFGLRNSVYIDIKKRMQAANWAWKDFLTQPLVGVGRKKLFKNVRGENSEFADDVGHAHNLVIQILATEGVLGLIAWLIPLFILTRALWKTNRTKMLPLMIVMTFVNLTDVTYYTVGVFYPFWLVLGLVANQRIKPSKAT